MHTKACKHVSLIETRQRIYRENYSYVEVTCDSQQTMNYKAGRITEKEHN